MRFALKKLGIGQIPVVLAGDGQAAQRIVATLKGDSYSGIRIAGYFAGTDRNDRGDHSFHGDAIPCLGTLHDIVPESRKRNVKILFACQDDRLFRAQMDEFATWFTYIDYLPASRSFPIFGARVVSFDGLGGLEMVNQGRMRMTRFQKRVIDGLFALLAFLVFLPVFVVVPVVVKLTSRGPVFYRHRRLGRDGRPIYILKFRTMYVDADERLRKILAEDPAAAKEWKDNFKLKNDPRVTPLGRFLRRTSLDEMPQLFNVLVGEMALVGPRPIVEEEKPYYGDRYALLASVKPGMTGLWQVSGRSDTDYARRVALDAQYILNWSPWMDIWILFRTVVSVVMMRGAR
jgi:undecaprenyl-phosphate galactose phosphotransferase